MVAHRDTSRVEADINSERLTHVARTFPRRLSHAYDEINSLQSPWSLVDLWGSNVVKGRTMPARVHHRCDKYDESRSPSQFTCKIRSSKDGETVDRFSTEKNVSTCQVPSPCYTDNLDSKLELYCSMRATW